MSRPLFADRQRDRAEQIRLQGAMERAMKSRVMAELKRVARAAADAVEADGDPVAAMKGHDERLMDIFQRDYRQTITRFGKRIIDAGAKAAPELVERKDAEGALEQSIQAFIASFAAEKVQQVTDTTKKQIRRALKNGTEAGDGVDKIARDMRRTLGGPVATLRAETIARTETHAAAQYGQKAAARDMKVPDMLKGWIDAGDGRERDSHRRAGEEAPIPLDDLFRVGRSRMEYPGDPSGAAKEVINCRCGQYFEIPD